MGVLVVIEGDTVYQAARRLDAALAGRPLESSTFRGAPYAVLDLRGLRVGSVVSRGKHVLIRAGSLIIHTNLGRGGRWEAYAPGERARTPLAQAHCVLRNADFTAAGFERGNLRVFRARDEPTVFRHLGPDPLGNFWDPAEAVRRLVLDPDRPIGLALLDQRLIAGIGDVYRSEALFLGRAHPLTPAGAVADLPRLVGLAHDLLHANKDRTRRLTAPSAHRAPYWVYGRAGLACPRCGTAIDHDILGRTPGEGRDPAPRSAPPLEEPPHGWPEPGGRDVYWCPRCQSLAEEPATRTRWSVRQDVSPSGPGRRERR